MQVRGLKKHFPIQRGFLRRTIGYTRAVDGVDFTIEEGETLGLVGESGSGKTTAGRCILRVVEPTEGKILFGHNGATVSVTEMQGRGLKAFRKNMQMIFQDPYSSLNPRMTVLEIVGEPLLVNGVAHGRELEERVAEMIVAVGLKEDHLRRYPHSFSGGQRQRIGIARALVLHPRLVVADEAVSALDVSVQAQIINLLQDLQERLQLTYLFVSHDMGVVRHICDRVAVMYAGKIVELAETETLLDRPKHPYTEALLSAVPRPDPNYHQQRLTMAGEAPDPSNLPSGCPFHPRCRYAEESCRVETPSLREVAPGHQVRCHLAEKLSLQGIPTVDE